jgi:hypothetical protein
MHQHSAAGLRNHVFLHLIVLVGRFLRRKREGKQRKIIALMSNLIGTEILYCP